MSSSASDLPCDMCGGSAKVTCMFPRYSSEFKGERKPYVEINCPDCGGKGYLTQAERSAAEAGEVLRRERLSRGYGLREAAEMFGILPSEFSAAEQGRIPVPDGIAWPKR